MAQRNGRMILIIEWFIPVRQDFNTCVSQCLWGCVRSWGPPYRLPSGERRRTSGRCWRDKWKMISSQCWVEVGEKDSAWKDQMWTWCAGQIIYELSGTCLSLSIITQKRKPWFCRTLLRVHQASLYWSYWHQHQTEKSNYHVFRWMTDSTYLILYTEERQKHITFLIL